MAKGLNEAGLIPTAYWAGSYAEIPSTKYEEILKMTKEFWLILKWQKDFDHFFNSLCWEFHHSTEPWWTVGSLVDMPHLQNMAFLVLENINIVVINNISRGFNRSIVHGAVIVSWGKNSIV